MQCITLIGFLLLSFFYCGTEGIIVSPCKVRNLVTQPSFGTSLKTKGLVQIIQMPPVFVQNVMVGICETQNQNISTGRIGEFYSCQQRYSIVEVYIAEAPQPSNAHQQVQPTLPDPFYLKFARESVIIESGCDFTFNLLPLITGAHGQESQQVQAIPPQQKMFLRSPYHSTIPIRRQPGQSDIMTGTTANYYQNPLNYPQTMETKGRSVNEDIEDIEVGEDSD